MNKAIAAAIAIGMAIPLAGTRSTFVPDWTFKGSALTGWTVVGQADWRAVDGELVGTPRAPEGGWLILDKSFQDVQFGADFRCTDGCRTGVLLRAEKTPTGMKGVYVSLVAGDTGSYAITLDASGRELTRERLRAAGGMARFAPASAPAGSSPARGSPAPGTAPPQGRGGAPSGRAG